MTRSIVKPATPLEQLQALRLKWSVQELAAILGCSEGTLRGWLGGERKIRSAAHTRVIMELFHKLPKRVSL